ncbi:lysophospholipid acyltransferase LPEAT1 isoform X2 [Humulus lupulus]|uniref:lysophospholipid acyltransferase LPEAT1 isoform X2 n=1 Tax=Humulus lupulus TaxID=3486 RepID=UPI002B4090B5|nr:lysophospholipid acyltransferase LPEAT1 isoform X2 [Humulus lupulus]
MESELKDMSSAAQPPEPKTAESIHDDGSFAKDDRPLLKPEPSSAAVSGDSLEEMEKKFAAYVRTDVYGPMGRGQLPLQEKVLLGLAMVTLVPIRLVAGMTVLVVYYLICRICTLFWAPNRDEDREEEEDYAHMGGWRRAVIVSCGRILSRAMLFVFGFYWINETYRIISTDPKSNTENENEDQPEELERPGAIISNHVSYVDILYHMSSSFPSFVAKRSVARLPLVGLISKCLGCVFVQRESRSSDFKGVAAVVTERVCQSHQDESAPLMMLFPEGTTTNGDFLLPFKTGAFLAKAPVLPVILRYPYQRFSPAWDSISGVRHVILLLCQFVNYLEVTRLPIYYPNEQEKNDPKLFADNVRRFMAKEGNLVMSDIGLAEKRIYHAALNGKSCSGQ